MKTNSTPIRSILCTSYFLFVILTEHRFRFVRMFIHIVLGLPCFLFPLIFPRASQFHVPLSPCFHNSLKLSVVSILIWCFSPHPEHSHSSPASQNAFSFLGFSPSSRYHTVGHAIENIKAFTGSALNSLKQQLSPVLLYPSFHTLNCASSHLPYKIYPPYSLSSSVVISVSFTLHHMIHILRASVWSRHESSLEVTMKAYLSKHRFYHPSHLRGHSSVT